MLSTTLSLLGVTAVKAMKASATHAHSDANARSRGDPTSTNLVEPGRAGTSTLPIGLAI